MIKDCTRQKHTCHLGLNLSLLERGQAGILHHGCGQNQQPHVRRSCECVCDGASKRGRLMWCVASAAAKVLLCAAKCGTTLHVISASYPHRTNKNSTTWHWAPRSTSTQHPDQPAPSTQRQSSSQHPASAPALSTQHQAPSSTQHPAAPSSTQHSASSTSSTQHHH